MKLKIENLCFSYRNGPVEVPVLDNVSLSVAAGEFVAIRGRSGSGKSTLFHLIGALLKPTSGKIFVDGIDITVLSADQSAALRNEKLAFIFQQFHLLPRSTVLDNILLPTLYPSKLEGSLSTADAITKAKALAEKVGLSHRLHQFPNQLSGGEQQRVVIARALMNDSDLILADEPTGNLDSQNAENIMGLLKALNREGKTILLITHDLEIAHQCRTNYEMRDGRLAEGARETPFNLREADTPRASQPVGALVRTALPLAWQNLKRNKVRAFLTMLGVTIGIASVFAMLTFGRFAQEKVMKGYEELGANTIMVQGWGNWRRKATDKIRTPFEAFSWKKDVLTLRNVFPDIELLSPMMMAWGNTVTFSGLAVENDVNALGVNEYFLTITNREMKYGNGFTPYHIENKSSVCVIGDEIEGRLFRGINPLGKIVFVTSGERVAFSCQVIGVMARQISNKDWRKPNLEILLPFTYQATVHEPWNSEIHMFMAKVGPTADIQKISTGIRNYFTQKYEKAGEFVIGSDTKLIGQMKKSLGLFTILLTTIALITLGVGGVGINNMMLVSVTERFKEIGLRKAVGATNGSIRMQFLMEAVILAGVAGILGVIIGFAAYEAVIYGTSKVVAQMPFEWVLDPLPLAFSVISILIVGIGSGIIPAIKAERLEVIEALRSE